MSIYGMMHLVLENGAFQTPKGFVLPGFYVEMLLRLEDCSLDRAPVLGGDRFFNAILPLGLRVNFRSEQGFYRKRCRKRFRRGFETGKVKSVR